MPSIDLPAVARHQVGGADEEHAAALSLALVGERESEDLVELVAGETDPATQDDHRRGDDEDHDRHRTDAGGHAAPRRQVGKRNRVRDGADGQSEAEAHQREAR